MMFGVFLFSVEQGWCADSKKCLTAYESGDYAAALRECTPLAEQEDANAQHFLSVIYRTGNGVPRDYKATVKWFRPATK